MASSTELTAPPPPDISKMTKVQKLAALLIILGSESAAQILKTLESHELEQVSAEMARLPMITHELRAEIMNEMSEVALTAGTSVRGGVEFAQTALEKAVGAGKAMDILQRVTPGRAPSCLLERVVELDPRLLFNLIKDEHAQTIAMVMSYVRSDKASELFSMLRPELRDQIIERLATLGPTPVEVPEIVADVLQRRLSGKTVRGLNQTGGVKSAADLLNALNKNVSKSILASLEERNAELGQAIRHKMFTFADLVTLDNASLQKVLRDVDMRDLALALKKSEDAFKARLLAGISKRAAEAVNEEIGMMGSVKLKEIDAAQLRIIEVVRRLENDGEIDLEALREAAAA